jgi:hypothetical protein
MKQLIILVATLSVGSMSEVKTRVRMSELRAHLAQIFDQKVQDETNTIIKIVVLPGSSEQPTTLECIYPAATTENIEKLISELLDKTDKAFKL